MTKIFIIGLSGSGKTHLAKKIKKKIKIPHFDIDDIYWKRRWCEINDKTFIKEKLDDFLDKNDSWIIEGVYTDFVDGVIKKADKIIWLDFNRNLMSFRILHRYFTDQKKNQCSTFQDTLRLIKIVRESKPKVGSYLEHENLLKRHKIDFIKINNKKELKKYLKNI